MTDTDEPNPLLELFRTEVRGQLAILRAGGGRAEMVEAARTIRGAARIVGATALAEIAADLEHRLGDQPDGDYSAIFDTLAVEHDRVGQFPNGPTRPNEAPSILPSVRQESSSVFDIDPGLLELFRGEVRSHCTAMTQSLIDLELEKSFLR